jgi:stage III sporulation protein AH
MNMFVLKRNQIIITALIVMIAVAGYLNYQDSRLSEHTGFTLTETGEIDALAPSSLFDDFEIGEAFTYGEFDDPSIALEEIDTTEAFQPNAPDDNPGESVFVNAPATTFFIQAKFDREQARSKEKSLLTDMINNVNLGEDKKAEAADNMMEIQKRIEKETAAEAMIEAKGFSEVYVRIDDDSVDVVVNKEALTDAEIAQIEDIIKRKTGMTVDKIHISPMRR